LIDEELPPPSVSEAIDSDGRLTSDQKKVLLDMYRALVRTNGNQEDTKQE
jgi:hypothetical protein